MTPADLTAKARRAAEWSQKQMPYISAQETIRGVWNVYEREQSGERLIWGQLSPGMLVGFAEDRGWQDEDSKPLEFVEVKGVESATLNQEQEANGVEWISHQSQAWVNNCFLEVDRLACGKWTYKMTPTKNRVLLSTQSSGGTAPTIEEAKRRVVETAKRWNQ